LIIELQLSDLSKNALNYGNSDDIIGKRYFLMCASCYWCVTCLTDECESRSICPSCNAKNMEFLYISNSESYSFDNDGTRGVVLEFWTEIEGHKTS
jgi:hypothetical protein